MKHDSGRLLWWWLSLTTLLNSAHAAGGPGNALRFFSSANRVQVEHTNALNAYPLTEGAATSSWFRWPPGGNSVFETELPTDYGSGFRNSALTRKNRDLFVRNP